MQDESLTLTCTMNNHPDSVMFTVGTQYKAILVNTHGGYELPCDSGHYRYVTLINGKAYFPLGTDSNRPEALCYGARFEVSDD